jgi:hypothetical protein
MTISGQRTYLDREAVWLPLLRRVTSEFPRWGVWKNAESAFHGPGDIDSFAPPEDWPAIQEVFLDWVRANGFAQAIICRHVPQGPHFVALQESSPFLYQFDVKERATYRGSTLLDVDSLARLSEIDPRGFRRIRPGAEGVLKLLYNGMTLSGRRDGAGLRTKRTLELLAGDPRGVEMAADLVGLARRPLLKAVESALAGDWDRAALNSCQAWCAARALAEPHVAASRVWFNQVLKKRCHVLDVIRNRGRRVPDDRPDWLAAVRPNHQILEREHGYVA